MISFATPAALVALVAVPLLVAAVVYEAARRRAADRTAGGSRNLRLGVSRGRRRLRTALLLLAVLLVALAVARPQWGTRDAPITRTGIDVVIALDISRSMEAQDVAPSRAGAAAERLREMLAHLRGDRVGLVTFAGSAFRRSPLTLDLQALAQLVAAAQGESPLVRRGTDVGGALKLAFAVLDVADPARTQAIVLISDGEDLSDNIEAALDAAAEQDIRIYTVAAGTAEGAAVPARPGEDASVTTRADRATLDRIARTTGGNSRDVQALAGLAVEFTRLRQSQLDDAQREVPIERFQWLLAAALLLLVAQSTIADAGRAVRPGSTGEGSDAGGRAALAATVLASAWLLLGACAAPTARDEVARGNRAYESGEYETALARYREAAALSAERDDAPDAEEPVNHTGAVIEYNAGNALHRLGRFEEATVASLAAVAVGENAELIRRSLYAAGSHAFRREELAVAREAWIAVLLRDPDDDDARHNLELVLLALGPPPVEPPPAAPPPAQPTAQPPAPPGGDNEEDATSSTDEQGPPGTGQPPNGGGTSTNGNAGAQPPGEPGEPPSGGGLEEAQAALEEALLALGGDQLTAEQAVRILDLLRAVGGLSTLEARGARFDPLDR